MTERTEQRERPEGEEQAAPPVRRPALRLMGGDDAVVCTDESCEVPQPAKADEAAGASVGG